MQRTEFEDFCNGYFQEQMEQAYELDRTPSPEERPFDNRYEARKIYLALLQDPHFVKKETPVETPSGLDEEKNDEEKPPVECKLDPNESIEVQDLRSALIGVIRLFLADNYFDTEENSQAYDTYKAALQSFQCIFDKTLEKKFWMYLFKVFTNLGFLEVNRDNTQIGLGYLLEGNRLYEQLQSILKHHPQNVTNFNFDLQIRNETPENEIDPNWPKTFQPLMMGGINLAFIEPQYTQLLFYMAQSYAKLEDRSKAAEYSGLTMRRQLSAGMATKGKGFDFTDFSNNCVGLARYYAAEFMFNQALHILAAGLHHVPKTMLPEIGSLHFMRGTIMRLLFDFNMELISSNPSKSVLKEKETQIQKIVLELEIDKEIIDDGPSAQLYDSYDGCKEQFRKALADFKKGMELLPLDGYVTDHGEIVKELVRLYGTVAKYETDLARIEAIQQRRIEFIEPVLSQLNPKYYENLYIELQAEMGEVKSELFEIYAKAYESGAKVGKKMNKVGREAVGNWTIVIDYFAKIKNEAVQSYVNSLYNKARILNKMIEKDRDVARENLAQALKCYQEVRDFLREIKSKNKLLDESLESQLRLTEEFSDMLPYKISKL